MNLKYVCTLLASFVTLSTLETFAQDSTAIPAKVWHQKASFRVFAAPTVLIAYGLSVYGHNGAYSSYDSYRDIQLNWSGFHTNIDNVTQFVPAAAVYGLNMIGIKGQNTVFDASCLYVSSLLISTIAVQGLKHSISELRPDGSAYNSFPSGHTATAFAAAEFLHQEYGKKSVWYSIAGYTMASLTGALRMLNNKHWQSDVLVGAGIGILSTKLSYYAYPCLMRRKKKASIPE